MVRSNEGTSAAGNKGTLPQHEQMAPVATGNRCKLQSGRHSQQGHQPIPTAIRREHAIARRNIVGEIATGAQMTHTECGHFGEAVVAHATRGTNYDARQPTVQRRRGQQNKSTPKLTQVALLWQRDRATRLSVEFLQLTKHPI